MFSGIIEQKAKVISVDNGKITVKNTFTEELNLGQSIAHDGACMTITEFDSEKYSFFAMEESFKKTNFGTKNVGDYFNVERSLNYGGKVDGHFVSGHIDCIGTVENIDKLSDGSWIIKIHFPEEFANNVIEKGSITINGISLTVVDKGTNFLTVSVIPLTQEITNIGQMKTGESVNLEFDMMGKYIVQYMKNIQK